MNNVSDILKLADQAQSEQIEAVLATVVHTQGSAYRKAGAMMLICADGRSAGMISGGCLEPHIIKKAFWLTRQGPVVQVYQTGDDNYDSAKHESWTENDEADNEDLDNDYFDSELELNFGIGCNGRVHVLFERLATALPLLQSLKQVRQTGKPQNVATLVRYQLSGCQNQAQASHYQNQSRNYQSSGRIESEPPIGLHVDLDQSAITKETVYFNQVSEPVKNNPILNKAVSTLSSEHYAQNKAQFVTLQGLRDNQLQHRVQTQWLVRRLQPQIKLLICGAGNDVMPLVTLAKMQDWHVTVIDSRSHYATRSRFMQADKVLCLPLQDKDTLIELSRNAAVAVMSHSLTQDRARLKVLFAHPPAYLGQLGPKYRTERLINEITEAYDGNVAKLQPGIAKLQYPIGYKLGGEGPEALALGIMAQMNAVMHEVDLSTVDSGNITSKQPTHRSQVDSSQAANARFEVFN
ncbi:XdhC family protein [Psychrobacter phenylpyruvicus]|uniref:Xanthine dehydrogenase accessory protein XdhC n=1 Tax=Psychrobacter phenylpyruvicus TaxID=29432 RepID=A0A379LL68_9GAMM|nr:XdhC/CoxI family protein [Psychrobacter phenylpyruvicus]SUD90637.1 xanthine dehydrogenase accessory protein XdhC [Psychrobacter phenylpyruvicus]